MRISDWSSDVCSSDLEAVEKEQDAQQRQTDPSPPASPETLGQRRIDDMIDRRVVDMLNNVRRLLRARYVVRGLVLRLPRSAKLRPLRRRRLSLLFGSFRSPKAMGIGRAGWWGREGT